MRFYLGDQVMISPDLSKFDTNKWPGINYQMMEMAGCIATISSYSDKLNTYLMRECNWRWLEEWLCPLNQEDEDIHDLDMNSIL